MACHASIAHVVSEEVQGPHSQVLSSGLERK